jgi:uncharacterized membrane-anchored protein
MQNMNSRVMQEMRDVSRNQDAVTALPSSFSPSIQLVAEVNPKLLQRVRIVANVTSGSPYTSPAGKKLIITGVVMSIAKDATHTGTYSTLNCVINGGSVGILRIVGLTLTADSQTVVISFPVPIECDANTAVTHSLTGTYGNQFCGISGYLVDA